MKPPLDLYELKMKPLSQDVTQASLQTLYNHYLIDLVDENDSSANGLCLVLATQKSQQNSYRP